MEGYILLTIIMTVATVLGIQRLSKSNRSSTTPTPPDTSRSSGLNSDADFAEFVKINDTTAEIGVFDPLTGLPDKQIYDQRLKKTLEHSKTHNHRFSVMILNIDEFENVVNVYGNAFANQLLVKTANRLRPTLRQIDTICRYKSDNFYFIFPELSTTEIAILVAQRLQDSMAQPFIIENHRIFLTASIGISIYNPLEDTVSSMINHAENALVKAKLSGRNTFRIHYQDSYSLNKDLVDVNAKLASSLYIDRLSIRYQPFVDVYNKRTKALQANLYLNEPELGSVPFKDFCKAAEVSGKALEVSLWQVKAIINQIKKWENIGYSPENIIINVPFSQFVNTYFIDSAKRMFEDANCDKSKVIFDVTELKFTPRNQQFETALAAVQNAGFHISISILGIGRLTRQNIMDFPLAYVKIDDSLVNDLFSSANYEPIITSVIASLNNSNIEILAEGVDYDYQKAKLLKLGCSTMIGKLFAAEVTEDDITFNHSVQKQKEQQVEIA